MTSFLTATLNSAFGRAAKAKPTTKLVAILSGHELPVTKRDGLWTVEWGHLTLKNSRLGDLIEQIEERGGSVERRPA